MEFFEIDNSMGEEFSPTFIVTQPSNNDRVSFTLSGSDGILLRRWYNFTITASNSAGSSAFVGSLCEL